MMIGSFGHSWRIVASVSSSSSSGISISSTRTSGCSSGIFINATRPLDAAPTTVSPASRVSAAARSRRITTESSTMSTRVVAISGGNTEQLELFLEHVGGERLHDVLVGARLERLRDMGELGIGGDHHHRQAVVVDVGPHLFEKG